MRRYRLDPAETRFIGTMNYGYAGTRELNEALVSRFLVIDMPEPDEETLARIIPATCFPDPSGPAALVAVCRPVPGSAAEGCPRGDYDPDALDLRGMLGALRHGADAGLAAGAGGDAWALRTRRLTLFEKELVNDVVMTRLRSFLDTGGYLCMNDHWEMRLKNLLWTVSGDYSLEMSFEDDKWEETPWAALYDAVKEGAYVRYPAVRHSARRYPSSTS